MNIKVNKELYSNLREALYKISDGWIQDIDEANKTFIYEMWSDQGYKSMQQGFTYDGTEASLTGTPTEVVIKNEVKVVAEDPLSKSLVDKAIEGVLKHFGGSVKDNAVNKSLAVIKQFEDEKMVAIEKLYINPITEVDLVGDTMTLEDTRNMVVSLNKAIDSEDGIQSGLFHKANADDVFTVEKAWIAETDCMIGETLIEEGQPLIKIQFHNAAAWELRKSGELQGISIGARATAIEEL